MRFALHINEHRHEVTAPASATLLDVLRDELGLSGTKKGSNMGGCGAGAVLSGGRRILACLTLAAAHEGRAIVAISSRFLRQRRVVLAGVAIARVCILRGGAAPGREHVMGADFHIGPRHFRGHAEFRRWFEIRHAGFGPWYVNRDPPLSLLDNRHVSNCHAALFPDFQHEVRTTDGKQVGYLSTVPGYWSGDPQSLHTYDYIHDTLTIPGAKMLALTAAYLATAGCLRAPALFERIARRLRPRRQSGANAVFLVAINVDPEYRSHHLPGRLIGAAKEAARRLGYDYVCGPFRPTGYGAYKAERRAAHSDALFTEYCTARNAEGLPIDPWLRNVTRNGGRLLCAAPRSYVLTGTGDKFERLRRTFRPGAWYSPAPDVWECGETCTWYVDRARRIVVSVEPNWWGVMDVRLETGAAGPPTSAA